MALRGEKQHFFTWKKLVSVVVILVLAYATWLFFFNYEDCDSFECFTANLESCERARYVGGNKMIFEYTILRATDDKCVVNVELLQGELNNQDSIILEGQEMICKVPKGIVMLPGSDISRCSGALKEGLQDLVIQKIHSYIVQNLGRINLDVLDVPN